MKTFEYNGTIKDWANMGDYYYISLNRKMGALIKKDGLNLDFFNMLFDTIIENGFTCHLTIEDENGFYIIKSGDFINGQGRKAPLNFN